MTATVIQEKRAVNDNYIRTAKRLRRRRIAPDRKGRREFVV